MDNDIDYTGFAQSFLSNERRNAVSDIAGVPEDNDPEKVSRSIELSDATGVPAEQILPNLDNFETQHQAVLNSDLVASDQWLQRYIRSHPLAAKLSHDDMANLSTAGGSIAKLRNYIEQPQRVLDAMGQGFLHGFTSVGGGPEPGSWIPLQDLQQHPFLSSVAATAGMFHEGLLRTFSGGFEGLVGGIQQAASEFGANPDFAKEIRGMVEADTMGLTGRHGMPLPEMQAVVAGAVHAAEPFLRNGEMPPTGVHPYWDSLYKADAEAKAKQLDEAVSDSAATATRERSPEFFKNFAEGPAADAKIRIDANAVAQLYGDKAPEVDDGILGWVPDLQERLDATAGSGGYIDVPLKDWLAHIDKDVHKELRDDILIGDHGFTVNEAKEVPDFEAPKAEAAPEGEADAEAPPAVDHTGTVDTPTQVVRGAAGLEPMLAVGDRKLTLAQRVKNAKMEDVDKADGYHLLDQDGNKVGWLDVIPSADGKQLYVENVGGFESKGYNPNSFGPALVRSLLRQLKEKYPGIEEIGGFRISGAREKAGAEGAATVKLDAGDPQHIRDFTQLLRDNWEHVTDDGQVEALFHTEDKGLAANSPLGQMIMAEARRFLPNANIDIAHGLVVGDKPAYGAFIPGDIKQIIVSLESKHPLGTLRHEGIHWLRDKFTPEEWSTLEAASYTNNWEKKFRIAERWGDLPRDQAIEESIAEGYVHWWNEGEKVSPEVHGIFMKIKEFFNGLLKRVADHLGLRADNWDDVFHRVESGEVGRRDSFEQSGGIMAQRPEAPEPINIKPPFAEGKAIGIRQDIYKRYMKLIEQRHASDLAADFAAAHDDERRRQTKEWKDNASAIREQVTAELDEKPNILVDRLMSERGGSLKIDPLSVREDLREALPKDYFRRTNSISADDLAGHFGYPSGDALVEHLGEVAAERKASGLSHGEYTRKLIDDEVARRMESQYGWLEKNVLEDAKDRAFSQNQIDILHEETLALAEHAGARLPLERSAIDRELTQAFMATPTGSIKSSLWIKAAGKAGREAEEALLKDDPAEAFKAKQRQYNATVQGKLALAYEKAAKALDKTAKRVGKLEPARGKPTPIEPEYLNHVQDLLRRVGYNTRRSLENIRENISRQSAKTVQQFVESKLAESGGYRDIPLAEFLWDPGFNTPKEKLTAQQFYDFKNTIDGLVREGRDEQTVYYEGEKADTDAVRNQMIAQMKTFPEQEVHPGKPVGIVRRYGAAIQSMETVWARLDRGDRDGVFHKYITYPLARAANGERKMLRDIQEPYRALPDAGDLSKLIASPLDPQVWKYSTFTRENLLGLIQNAGNKSNWDVTARGWGAKPEELWDWLVKNSQPEDWLRAQQLGKTVFNKLISEADTRYEHRYGSTIDKIPLTPFELEFPPGPDGQPRKIQLDGWYHPLVHDPQWEGNVRSRGSVYDDVNYRHAATSNGYTKARTGATYPVDLSFSSIPRLVNQMVHDINFRDAVLDVQKIVKHGSFLDTLAKNYGPEYKDMVIPYLQDMAGKQGRANSWLEAATPYSEYLRQNTISTYIGFNPYTVAKHAPTAFFMSAADVGYGNFLSTYYKMLMTRPDGRPASGNVGANFVAWQSWIREQSEEIQARERNWQDTFGVAQKELYGEHTLRERMSEAASWMVAKSDIASAGPLWATRYFMSLADGDSVGLARDKADISVRTQHGSTAITNQPEIVRMPGPVHGWLTSVYGFFGTVMQRRIEGLQKINDMYQLGKEGEIKEAAKKMPGIFWNILHYAVLPTLIEEKVTSLTTENHEGWGEYMLKAAARGAASSFPYLRDLVYGFTTGHDPGFGLLSGPMHDADKAINDVKKGRDAVNRQHAGKSIQDFLTFAGIGTGLAPKEFANIARFGIDYANRQQHPKAVTDWLRGLTRGDMKKREEK